jgi:hypothetical protein
MIILIHVVSAIVSLVLSTYCAIAPSKTKLVLNNIVSIATLISGAAVTVVRHVSLSQVCVSGLLYLVFTGAMLFVSHIKLAKETIRTD